MGQKAAEGSMGQTAGGSKDQRFPFRDIEVVEISQEEKVNKGDVFHGILWVWKSQLKIIKLEVDRALLQVLEGLESIGPVTQAVSQAQPQP
jgi:hypothetical protein